MRHDDARFFQRRAADEAGGVGVMFVAAFDTIGHLGGAGFSPDAIEIRLSVSAGAFGDDEAHDLAGAVGDGGIDGAFVDGVVGFIGEDGGRDDQAVVGESAEGFGELDGGDGNFLTHGDGGEGVLGPGFLGVEVLDTTACPP